MGLIKAFSGAIGGTFADQWLDYYKVPSEITATTAVVRAVKKTQDNGRGSNTKGSENVISNGSKIQVPEGFALILMQDGAITGLVTEPGGYTWNSEDQNSKTVFAGNGLLSSTVGTSWERFKFGGMPSSQQAAYYVNLKEISGIKFGTSEQVQWTDNYYKTRLYAYIRGNYSVKITDPIAFVKNFVPFTYLDKFDLNDLDENNTAVTQLVSDIGDVSGTVVTELSQDAALSDMATYDYISEHRDIFGKKMNESLEQRFRWNSERGISVLTVAVIFNYSEESQEKVNKFADKQMEIELQKQMGAAYSTNMPGMMAAASATAMNTAAANENGAMMGFMGMNMAQQGGANMMGAINNMQPAQSAQPAVDNTEKLLNYKKLLDAGAISQEEYDKLKAQLLGL